MPTLFSKREDKCKQCQNKKSKGHKVLKGKMIHKHHLHSKKNGASTTLQHGCQKYCNITNRILQEIKKSLVLVGSKKINVRKIIAYIENKKADKNLRKKNESDIVKEERQPPTRWVARLVRRKAAP